MLDSTLSAILTEKNCSGKEKTENTKGISLRKPSVSFAIVVRRVGLEPTKAFARGS
jgi:hypothetical protein